MKRLIIFLLFMVIIARFVIAQTFFDAAKISYHRWTYAPENMGNYSLSQFQGALNIPIELKGGKKVFLGWEGTSLNFQSEDIESVAAINVFSNATKIGYLHTNEGSKWAFFFQSWVRINGDYTSISKDDLQLGGLATASYQSSKTLKYLAGGYYNQEFFGPLVLPILGVDWQVNKRLNVLVLAPQKARVEYALSPEKWYIGGGMDLRVRSYRIHDMGDYDYLRKQDINAKAFLDYQFAKNLVLFTEVGYLLLNNYEFFNDADQKFDFDSFDRPQGFRWNAKVGMALRVRLKNFGK